MIQWKIPLSDITLGEEEAQAVADVVRSRWLTAGAKTNELERRFAELHQVKSALAVTNCTAALELAYESIGVGPGDEVIVPSLTFVATANAVRVVGGSVVFADVISERDLTVDPNDIEQKITPKTKAITVVHYGGYPAHLGPVLELCKKHNLKLIEDCAHAPGGTYQNKPLGSFGEVGCFSFFGNKNMTTGEGGMLTTQNETLAQELKLLRSHGMTTGSWDRFKGHASAYDVVRVGHNVRFDDLRAAIGLVQLDRLAGLNQKRRELVHYYREKLRGLVTIPFDGHDESTFHLMVVLLPPKTDRENVKAHLQKAGIQTSMHYPPSHMFRVYEGGAALPKLEAIAPRILTLPLYPAMTHDHIDTIAETLKESL